MILSSVRAYIQVKIIGPKGQKDGYQSDAVMPARAPKRIPSYLNASGRPWR